MALLVLDPSKEHFFPISNRIVSDIRLKYCVNYSKPSIKISYIGKWEILQMVSQPGKKRKGAIQRHPQGNEIVWRDIPILASDEIANAF